MTTYAILDFETTGMSPDHGACPTEIAIVLVKDGQITDRYQSLMNGNTWIPPFIESLTGITNAMIRKAPPMNKVMGEAIVLWQMPKLLPTCSSGCSRPYRPNLTCKS